MAVRGTIRAMVAAAKRAERESQRQYRELQRYALERAKMEARQRAAYEVQVYDNQIERLLSVHKESPDVWNWRGIHNRPAPVEPKKSSAREEVARDRLNAFTPGFLDKLLGRVEMKRQLLAQAMESAKAQDEEDYKKDYREYQGRYMEWHGQGELSGRILQGNTEAYREALMDFNPFADINELGASYEFKPHTAQLVEIRLRADGEKLVPEQIKSLTSTGKLSAKPMPNSQFFEIYQHFVCGVALRAGRELFAFLPVQTLLVNVQANLLDTRTGHQGLKTILSVAMTRTVFGQLNFNRLDPCDAMENFPHRMDFKKSSGFEPVEPLTGEERGDFQKGGPEKEKGDEGVGAIPTADALKAMLSGYPAEEGCHWVPAGVLASLMGIETGTKLTIAMCRRMAEAIENGGYCIEPDARSGSGVYDWEQKLGIFKVGEMGQVAPSPAYHGAANLLKLCVVVAAADGAVNKEELSVFRQVIESQLHFSGTELKRLTVLERVLAENAAGASKMVAKVAKAIPAEKRLLVGQVLVRVAAVDHVITKSEFRALERVFKAFELAPKTLSDLMLQVCPSPDGVRIQEGAEGARGEAVPGEGKQRKPEGFSLNMDRVCAIANETKEVVGILSVVMDDEPGEAPTTARPTAATQAQVLESKAAPREGGALAVGRFIGLESAFQPILERLLAQESWPRNEFHALANEFHLMPLRIQDVINEWADESLGDFLMEGEDPIVVHRELIRNEKS